jgi:hypothetical protein
VVGEPEWRELLLEIAPISEGYLRKLLRATGARLAPTVEGVVQETMGELERTLAALARAYQSGERARSRQLVVTAKDHARWAARNEEKRALKLQMIEVMLVWLENPGLFETWLRAKHRTGAARTEF